MRLAGRPRVAAAVVVWTFWVSEVAWMEEVAAEVLEMEDEVVEDEDEVELEED